MGDNAICSSLCQSFNDGILIEGIGLLLKLIASVKIGVLPGDGRYDFGGVRALRVPIPFLELKERGRAAALLKRVGLAKELHKTPDEMSGSQNQRASTARSFVNRPCLLIAD